MSLFFLPLGVLLAGPVHYFLLGFEALLSGLNKASFLTVALGHQSAFRLCVYGILFASILMLSHLKNRHFILMMLALWLVFLPDRSRTVIANLSVGQGDCGVILSKENVIVIDCGSLSRKEVGKKVLKPFLLYYGYREADYVILSHTDADHVNGIANCGDVFGSAREIFVSPNYKDAPEVLAPAVKEDRIRYVRSGDSLTVGGIDIRFLTYPIEGDDVNDGCLLAEVQTEGYCFWFLGDISEAVLSELTKEVSGPVYAVKVPHHGSRFSLGEAFYDAVKPETAVISVGRNTYGHPAEEVLAKLKETGAKVYVTKECGAVLTYIRHGKIYTESFLQE
jgi:competence protein ComEC